MARPLRRILVATDFSGHSASALAWAEELASRFAAEVIVLHVEEPIARVPAGDLTVEAHHAAERDVAGLVAGLRARGIRARGLVRTGVAFEQVIDAAGTEEVDAIVLGTHGRTGLSHLLMGSVAERVVRRAPCPVLTVPDERHAATTRTPV